MRSVLFAILPAVLGGASAYAEIPSSKSLLAGSNIANLRFSLDISNRQIYRSRTDEVSQIDSLGFDLHKVVSGVSGDVGTLLMQGYVMHIDNIPSHPALFDESKDTKFQFRIFNFNYKLLSRDKLNVRVGHFEIPFGLEQIVNTNGTLRDFVHGPSFGMKTDWGVSANGSLDQFEYEFAVTRGSGNGWDNGDGTALYSGRIGTYSSNNVALGLSLLSGEVNPEGSLLKAMKRERVGVDLQWHASFFSLLAEYSRGKDDGLDAKIRLLEINTSAISPTWAAYVQWFNQEVESEMAKGMIKSTFQIGSRWDVSPRWDVSAQFSHDYRNDHSTAQSNTFAAQVRYRF